MEKIEKKEVFEEPRKIEEKIVEKIEQKNNAEIYIVNNKKKKPELVKEYLHLCKLKGIPPYTENKINKTKKSEIAELIIKLKKDPEIKSIPTIPNFNNDSKNFIGEQLYELNHLVNGFIEGFIGKIDKNKKFVDLDHLYMRTEEIKPQLVNAYSECYKDFPEFCNFISHWGARASMYNLSLMNKVSAENKILKKKKNIPITNEDNNSNKNGFGVSKLCKKN